MICRHAIGLILILEDIGAEVTLCSFGYFFGYRTRLSSLILILILIIYKPLGKIVATPFAVNGDY